MKIKALLIALSWTLLFRPTDVRAFQNLDFEQARIIPSSAGEPWVVASSALPFWTVYVRTTPIDGIIYNSLTAGSPAVSIHDGASEFQSPLGGNYSVLLQHSSGSNPAAASIGQAGHLPSDVRSLIFEAVRFQYLQVTFDGASLPLVLLEGTQNHSIVGADISQYAGQSGELLFSGLYIWGPAVDNIRFSTEPIPEPSTITLLAMGGVLLFGFALRRWRTRS